MNNPSTAYNYSASGNLLSITYPLGRVVTYNYGVGGNTNRVASIDITVFPGGGGAPFGESLLTGVSWEPYGGLRGFSYATGTSPVVSNTVDFSRSGPAQAPVTDACTAALPTTAPDGTGRLTGLFVSQNGGSGNVLRKFLSWTGEQLTTEQTCFNALGQAAEHRQDYSLDKTARLTGVAGANMPTKTGAAAYSRTYGYSTRGNRAAATLDGCPRILPLVQDVLVSQTPAGTSACGMPKGANAEGISFSTDADGRTSSYIGTTSGFTMNFQNSVPASSGLETVLHTVELNRVGTVLWHYYYDAFNRRRAKVNPLGTVEEFFYDTGHQLLQSSAPRDMARPELEVDDYVWLGGQAVAVIRGSMDATGLRGADYTGNGLRCPRYTGETGPGNCGPHLIINDWLPKPVMMVEKATGKVTGAALYDEFGHVNRVMAVSAGGNGFSGTLGSVSLPSVGNGIVDSRAFWRIVQMNSGYASYAGATVTAAASEWGAWKKTGASGTASVTGSAYAVQMDWVEYRRYNTPSTGAVFTSLRFPGQYWDEETDLFENWNRYYDASTGRYLSPEPMLQLPYHVRLMAGSGMSFPAYSYAGNDPLTYVDADGLRISWSVGVSYDYGASAPGSTRFGPTRPGTTIPSIQASWTGGCKNVNGKFKFDAKVKVDIQVDLAGEEVADSLNDGNACSISKHEEKHVEDIIDAISGIEEQFPSEGFNSRAQCNEAFKAFTKEANIIAYGKYVVEASRSARDPFDFAR